MENVHIGQKLIIEDLSDIKWQKVYADPFSLSSMLKECGISFVEFSIKETTEESVVLKFAELFAKSGLFISLHPHFHRMISPEAFNEDIKPLLKEKLLTAQKVGNITEVPVSYVFHGGQAMAEPFLVENDQAVINSKNFISYIDRVVAEEYGNVVPLCETQIPNNVSRNKSVRLGDTWQSCMELVEETNVGICWDYGHTYIASLYGLHKVYPDDHFIARVNHIHAHDAIETSSGLIDHQPLNKGAVPWREYNAILARHEFNGTILLEINPRYYGGLDSFLAGTADGIKKIRTFFS